MSSIGEAIRELRAAQKSNRGAPAYSRFVNRPLGRILAAIAYTIGLTPNTVTLISGAVTLSGIALIATLRPTWWSSVLVAGLLVLGYALDSADGQVARLMGRSSLVGEWLDHMMDSLKLATIHLAVLICWFRFFELDTVWLLVPMLWQVVASVFFFGFILTDLLRRISALQQTDHGSDGRKDAAPVSSAPTASWYALAVVPSDYGLLCVVFLTLWIQPVFQSVYTALAVLNALMLAAVSLRWFRAVRRL